MAPLRRLRLGTRGSRLAQWQANWVAFLLEQAGVCVEVVPLVTCGDRQEKWDIARFGQVGVFTKEIQAALLGNEIDIAVHSMKDLPSQEVPGLCLGAVPKRGPVGDVLISRQGQGLLELPDRAVVGTGSRRRMAQLRCFRPDFRIEGLRGNLDTRIRKLDGGNYDAIVVAQAGVERLDLASRITQFLTPQYLLPAVGQGALAVECRADDRQVLASLQAIHDEQSAAAVLAERELLRQLKGGCLAPIAAWGRVERGTIILTGRVVGLDGRQKLEATCAGELAYPELLGKRLAELLIAQGALSLIEEAKRSGDVADVFTERNGKDLL